MVYEELNEIKEAYSKVKEAQGRFGVLTKPRLTDFGILQNLLCLFCLSMQVFGRLTAWQRKQYLFVVLWYYSPKTFFGGTMRHGLRNALSKLLQCSSTSLSHDCRDIYFYYCTYTSFRNDVDKAIEGINGIIKQ